MTARALLFAETGALRAPWRILAFLAATAGCALLAGLILMPLRPAIASTRIPLLADSMVVLGGVAGGTAIILRWIDPRPRRAVWLDREAARPRRLAEGWLLGVLAIALPAGALIAAGWLSVEPHAPGSWIAAAFRVSVMLLVAALAEELMFRGYILAVLRETIGWAPALAVTSVAFGYVHANNPGANARALVLVMLAGLFLGAVVAVTRSLYAAWMAHFAWNWTMAVLLHIPVSGLETETPDYRTVDAGPDWATGGPWGPEGGGGAALGMIAGLGYLAARQRRGVA
ncbi:MAG: lysostaphin resistance A-like protein [Gemmatimonadaceae bacterium]